MATGGLRRVLDWRALLVLGIANILGAGVYVTTGTAAVQFAGPAVALSCALAGFACLLIGLCYDVVSLGVASMFDTVAVGLIRLRSRARALRRHAAVPLRIHQQADYA